MQDRENLLSVVVPVYNVEQYLQQCLDSILNQTYTYLEIILVNDGSTDRSGEICNAYARLDSRVHVINQENQGVVVARRRAVEKATGKYIVFVDSDDYIEKDYFGKMLCVAKDYDLVTGGCFIDQDRDNKMLDKIEQGIYATDKQMEYIIDNMIIYQCGSERGLTPYIVNKLFRTDFAKRICLTVNSKIFWGEDSEFLYKYVLQCNSVCVTDICGYHYRTREQSTVHRKHRDYLINVNELYLSMEETFSKHYRKESLLLQLQIWISLMISVAPSVMGFSELAYISTSVRNIFPFYEEMQGKEIVLYGAGRVGREFFLQLKNRKDIQLVGWADKDAENYQEKGYPIMHLSEVAKLKCDYVIIAVKQLAMMEEIKRELIEAGIPKNKIMWKAPIQLIL